MTAVRGSSLKILFLHHNYPAQFGFLHVEALRLGYDSRFLCETAPKNDQALSGVERLANKNSIVPKRASMHAQLDCGYIYMKKMKNMLEDGFYPDVIVSHTGWGCGLFARYLFPKAKIIGYCELWFNASIGKYEGKDERFELDEKQSLSMFKRNITQSNEMTQCDEIVCATHWQKDLLPKRLSKNTHVIHEGTECSFFVRNDKWKQGEKNLITYATRGMEPMRGFPEFIDGTIQFMNKYKSNYRVEIAGQDKVFYGQQTKVSYKKRALGEIENHGLTEDIVFRGRLERKTYARLLKRSHIHCYFTKEFVPSWSLIDAMSTGCLLVVNRSASIKEILPKNSVIWIEDISANAVYEGLCTAMNLIKNEPEKVEIMRKECRESALRNFNRKESIDKWFSLFKEEIQKKIIE